MKLTDIEVNGIFVQVYKTFVITLSTYVPAFIVNILSVENFILRICAVLSALAGVVYLIGQTYLVLKKIFKKDTKKDEQ
jgi:nitrate reductase gamma subunit